MRRFIPWLWNHLTAERLAIAAFLVVAFGLWWGMQSRPEQVIAFQTEQCDPECRFSPDGTLCLVKERSDTTRFVLGDAKDYPWHCRLRVFDVATGQELWRWDSGQEQLWQSEWTARNQLLLLLPNAAGRKEGVPATGKLLGFDPRAGQEPIFRNEWPASPGSEQMVIAPDGNTVALVHPLANDTYEIVLADLRTGKARSFLRSQSSMWRWHWPFEFSAVGPWQFSPDSALLFCSQLQNGGVALLAYDVSTGKLRQRFKSESRVLRSFPREPQLPFMHSTDVALSPDGRLLAACHDEQGPHDTVRIWEVASGKLLATLDGFQPQRPDADGKPAEWGVGNLVFTPDGSQLCVGVGRVDVGSGGHGVFGTSELHLFETRTFQRLWSREWQFPQVSSDSQYVTVLQMRSQGQDVLSMDVQQQGTVPMVVPTERLSDFGFVPSSGTHDLHYVCTNQPVKELPWFPVVRRWLGLQPPPEYMMEIAFRDPGTGRLYDRWTFPTPLGKPPLIFSPQRDRLLVHFPQDDDWHRLEFYSLPPRRPWLHIFGWALAAGIMVELLGLGNRWIRRKKVQP